MNISDEFGQSGKVQVKTWSANKKTKECTIQIEKIKSEEVKYVKLFAETFIKYVLEVAMKSNNINNLFRDHTEVLSKKISLTSHKCDTCKKTFKEIRTLKMHVTRMHTATIIKQVQLRKSKQRTRCIHCNQPFTEDNLKKHRENIHVCKLCETISISEIERKRHMRDKHDSTTKSTSPKNKKRGKELAYNLELSSRDWL